MNACSAIEVHSPPVTLLLALLVLATVMLVPAIAMRLPSWRKRWSEQIKRDARESLAWRSKGIAPGNLCNGNCGQCGRSCAEVQRRWERGE